MGTDKWVVALALAVVMAPGSGKVLFGLMRRSVKAVRTPEIMHVGATEEFAVELADLGGQESHLDRYSRTDELGEWYPGEVDALPPLMYFDTIMLTGDFDRMHKEILCLT